MLKGQGHLISASFKTLKPIIIKIINIIYKPKQNQVTIKNLSFFYATTFPKKRTKIVLKV